MVLRFNLNSGLTERIVAESHGQLVRWIDVNVAANGEEMLIAQAAIAFERWTGVGGMTDVMRDAVAPLFAQGGVTA